MFDSLFFIVPATIIFAFLAESGSNIFTATKMINASEQSAIAISKVDKKNIGDNTNLVSIASDVYSSTMGVPSETVKIATSITEKNGYRFYKVDSLSSDPYIHYFSEIVGKDINSTPSHGHFVQKCSNPNCNAGIVPADIVFVLNTGLNYDQNQKLENLKQAIKSFSGTYLSSDTDNRISYIPSKQRTYSYEYGCMSKMVLYPTAKANVHVKEWYDSGIYVNSPTAKDDMISYLNNTGGYSSSQIQEIADELNNVKYLVNGFDPITQEKYTGASASTATGYGIPLESIDLERTIDLVFDPNPNKVIEGKEIWGLNTSVGVKTLKLNFENLNAYNTCVEPDITLNNIPVDTPLLNPALSISVSNIDSLNMALDNTPNVFELGVNPIEGILRGAEVLGDKNGKRKILVYIGPVRGSNSIESIVNKFVTDKFCKKLDAKFISEGFDFNLIFLATGNGYNEQTALGMDQCMRDYDKDNFYKLSDISDDKLDDYINNTIGKYLN